MKPPCFCATVSLTPGSFLVTAMTEHEVERALCLHGAVLWELCVWDEHVSERSSGDMSADQDL